MYTSLSLRFAAVAAAIASALLAASCGSGTPTSPAGGESHTLIATVMLESTGPNPRDITVAVGERVSFMNHDMVPHTVAAGVTGAGQPDCSEINAVGVLAPFEIRPTAPFSTPKTCDYHIPRGQSVLFSGRIFIR